MGKKKYIANIYNIYCRCHCVFARQKWKRHMIPKAHPCLDSWYCPVVSRLGAKDTSNGEWNHLSLRVRLEIDRNWTEYKTNVFKKTININFVKTNIFPLKPIAGVLFYSLLGHYTTSLLKYHLKPAKKQCIIGLLFKICIWGNIPAR